MELCPCIEGSFHFEHNHLFSYGDDTEVSLVGKFSSRELVELMYLLCFHSQSWMRALIIQRRSYRSFIDPKAGIIPVRTIGYAKGIYHPHNYCEDEI